MISVSTKSNVAAVGERKGINTTALKLQQIARSGLVDVNATGVYLLKLQTEDGVWTKKLMVETK